MRTFALVLFVAGLVSARPADACSIRLPELSLAAGVMEGRTEVPTNVVILYVPLSPDLVSAQSLWLRRLGEEALTRMDVALDSDFTRIRPPEVLEPGRDYQVLSFRQPTLPELGEDETLEDHAELIVTFRTGDGSDDVAPAVPTLLRSETQEVFPSVPFFEDSCGPVEGGTWARFFLEPHEDVFAYRLERDDPSVLADARFGFADGRDEHFVGEIARDAGGLHTYRITAIDLAGNESVPLEHGMYLGCPGACSSGDPAPFGLVLGLLALRFRRRRR